MADMLSGYTGQAFPQNPKPAPPSPEEKLASMRELLSDDMLGLLMRLIQGGVKTPPPMPTNAIPMSPEKWQRMFPMPPVHGPVNIPGVDRGEAPQPMRPMEPGIPVNRPSFIRG